MEKQTTELDVIIELISKNEGLPDSVTTWIIERLTELKTTLDC